MLGAGHTFLSSVERGGPGFARGASLPNVDLGIYGSRIFEKRGENFKKILKFFRGLLKPRLHWSDFNDGLAALSHVEVARALNGLK